jgi:predicted RNase H-like HicB family nuclease
MLRRPPFFFSFACCRFPRSEDVERSRAVEVISHKGFRARIGFDAEDGLFVGHLIDIDDIVGFHADSVEVLRAVFEEAVDDYVATRSRIDNPNS